MDHLHYVLAKNHYLEWTQKNHIIPNNSLDVNHSQIGKYDDIVTVPYNEGLSEQFRIMLRSFNIIVFSKSAHLLKSLFMHPKDPTSDNPKDVVYKRSCPLKIAIHCI